MFRVWWTHGSDALHCGYLFVVQLSVALARGQLAAHRVVLSNHAVECIPSTTARACCRLSGRVAPHICHRARESCAATLQGDTSAAGRGWCARFSGPLPGRPAPRSPVAPTTGGGALPSQGDRNEAPWRALRDASSRARADVTTACGYLALILLILLLILAFVLVVLLLLLLIFLLL